MQNSNVKTVSSEATGDFGVFQLNSMFKCNVKEHSLCL